MDARQFYETTIYNRDRGNAVAFATIPARSLADGEVMHASRLAERFRLDGANVEPVEAWSLPLLFDALLGRYPDFPWLFEIGGPYFRGPGRGPSQFAQYLAFAPVVPFEESPLGAKSIGKLVTKAGGTGAGAVLGILAAGDHSLLLTVPAGIILCKAAAHVGDGVGIGLRTQIMRLLGAEEAPPPDASSEEGR